MFYQTFARVVFAAVLFLAALFAAPTASAISWPAPSHNAPAFTATPLEQMDTVDVELEPIITPGQTLYLTPTPPPASTNVIPAKQFPQAATIKTLVVGLSMMGAGVAMVYFADIARRSDLKNDLYSELLTGF